MIPALLFVLAITRTRRLASVRNVTEGEYSPIAGVRRELDRRLDDAVGHPAVSYRSYSMLSRKLSTRCLSSFAAASS
jgi:hypothetical protein